MTEYFSIHQADLYYVIFIPIAFIIYMAYFMMKRYDKTKHIEFTLGDVGYSLILSLMSYILLVVFAILGIGILIFALIENAGNVKIRIK